MPEPRDLLSSYREMLRGLRRGAGPAGALFAPLEMTADVLEQVVRRQRAMEEQVRDALQPLEAIYELTRDAPASLRTQAKAFSAASASFAQAAELMNLQADLLDRMRAAITIPARLPKAVRPPEDDESPAQ
jgi:hypothetical protein